MFRYSDISNVEVGVSFVSAQDMVREAPRRILMPYRSRDVLEPAICNDLT
jgi:hypothetical protein